MSYPLIDPKAGTVIDALLTLLMRGAARIIALRINSCFTIRKNREREGALRNFILENMPEKKEEIDRLVRQSRHWYRKLYTWSFAVTMAVVLQRPNSLRRLTADVDVEGLDILERYIKDGVMGVSYHVGPMTLAPVTMGLLGYNTTFLVRPDVIQSDSSLSIEKINSYLHSFCTGAGVGLIRVIDSFKPFSIIQMTKRIRKGELLFVYPDADRSASAECIPIPFFKTPLVGHMGLAKLYRVTGARFLPFDIGWKDDGRPYLHIKEPLPLSPDMEDEEIVRTIYSGLEERLRNNLTQWVQVGSYYDLVY